VALRADYEKASQTKDYYYDLDALTHLTQFITESDRKTESAKKRLTETQEVLSTEASLKADKIHELAEKIGESLAKVEQLGAEGLVDESIKLMEEIDELKKLKTEAEVEYRASIPSAQFQQQKLRVCEVCCAYLGIHDNDRRLADHFGGKLHLGFIKVREQLGVWRAKVEERKLKEKEKKRRSSDDQSSRGRSSSSSDDWKRRKHNNSSGRHDDDHHRSRRK